MSSLCDGDLNRLEGLFTCVSLTENQVLCREGTRADHIYVVKRGFLRLLKAFFPQRKSLTRGPRAATKMNTGERGNNDWAGVKHFDLGELGPKDMLGESGLFCVREVGASATDASAAAAPLLGLAGNIDVGPSSSPALPTTSDDTEISTATTVAPESTTTASTAAPELQGSNQITEVSAMVTKLRQQRGNFAVSAVASRGGAQAYVASVLDLKPLLVSQR